MARSLVLHIGDPKTGTSSIQEVLLHRLWQSPTASLAYPPQLNSFPLANSISDPAQAKDRESRWTGAKAWFQGTEADVAVISSEQFFRVDPQDLKATLQEFLPGQIDKLRIIAYVRPHAARLVSAYMQRVKAGLFLGDMEMFWRRSQRSNLLTYAPRFRQWRDTFGDAFTLRPMIRSQLMDGDVVADFLDFALKGAPFSLTGQVQANTSMSLEHLAGLHEVQVILKRNEIAVGTRHAVGDHVSRSLAQLAPGKGRKLQLAAPLYKALHETCAEDAAELDAEFFAEVPIMAVALKEAGGEAIPAAQIVKARRHFPPNTALALREKAEALVALFKERPFAWAAAFESEIGQRAADSTETLPPKVQAHVERTNEILVEVAQLIAEGAIMRPQGKPAKGHG